MTTRAILLFILTFLVVGCSNQKSDEQLAQVNELAAVAPHDAFDSLKAINRELLSEPDRHFYDFLLVKVSDKAYITHTSDSIILDVISYESAHKKNGRYIESLYYGGRVYSDLGDYPTALRYFQEALSLLPPKSDIHLQGNILSQIGRLLNKLRLYDEAIPYIEKTIHIDSIENNKFNLAYDNQLIGSIYLHDKKPDIAEPYFRKALELASTLSAEDRAHMSMYLAACKFESNKLDSALSLIRGIPDAVAPIYRNISLAYASDIYLKSGISDTAYRYAFELAHSSGHDNRKSGYANLLSPELISLSSPDSILKYIADYKNILEQYYDEHEAQQALIQNSLYNYQIHERERFKAEKSRKNVIIGCCISLLFILLLAILFLIYRIKAKQTIIKLHETIARLDSLKQMMADSKQQPQNIRAISSDPQSLRAQLKQQIAQLDLSNQNEYIPYDIIDSDCYRSLKKFIDDKKFLPDANPLWDDLYNLITGNNPDFPNKLHQLFGGKLKRHELQTIILIRCGVTPTQMTFLLGKTKGSISSRRESLGIKIVGEKISLKLVDAIIRSL